MGVASLASAVVYVGVCRLMSVSVCVSFHACEVLVTKLAVGGTGLSESVAGIGAISVVTGAVVVMAGLRPVVVGAIVMSVSAVGVVVSHWV